MASPKRTFGERLCAAFSNITAPPMNGKRHNSMGGGRYVLLEDMIAAVQPHLLKEGLLLTFTSDIYENTLTVKAFVTSGVPDEAIVSSASCTVTAPGGRGNGATPHAVGATLTYLKRYALGLVVPIGTDEDSDHGAGAPAPQKPQPKEVLKTARHNPTKVEPTNKHAHLNSILKSLRLSAQTTAMTAKDMTADDAELVRETCELALQVNVTKVGSLRVDQLAAVAAALKSRRNQKAVDPEEDVPF